MKINYTRPNVDQNFLDFSVPTMDHSQITQTVMLKDKDARDLYEQLGAQFGVGGEETPEWRREGEWGEVALDKARSGDYAEFDSDINHTHVVGRISKAVNDGLIVDYDDLVSGDLSGYSYWSVRRPDGGEPNGMENLRIWRRLDPHRFDEPDGKGYYATQSGGILYNDGDSQLNWHTKANLDASFSCEDWNRVVGGLLDDSEFPLVRLTGDVLAKAVGERG